MGGMGVILQKSGTGHTTHRQSQTTTSYGEEIKILKEWGYCKRSWSFKGLKMNSYLTIMLSAFHCATWGMLKGVRIIVSEISHSRSPGQQAPKLTANTRSPIYPPFAFSFRINVFIANVTQSFCLAVIREKHKQQWFM